MKRTSLDLIRAAYNAGIANARLKAARQPTVTRRITIGVPVEIE